MELLNFDVVYGHKSVLYQQYVREDSGWSDTHLRGSSKGFTMSVLCLKYVLVDTTVSNKHGFCNKLAWVSFQMKECRTKKVVKLIQLIIN